MLLKTTACVAMALLCLAALAWADEEGDAKTLTIGDKAPDIDIAHWIKGVEMDQSGAFTPLTKFGDGKVYVLEFWATWCGPCVGGMPHLSELQEKFAARGVTIIGVSDETLPKVTGFLFSKHGEDGPLQNDRARYTLAADPDESVKNDYFRAAGQRGIPCAFVIGKDGFVEWIGHPMTMDDALEKVVEGTWDRAAFKEKFAKQQAEQKALQEANARMRAALQVKDWPAAIAVLDELLATMPDNARLLRQKFLLLVGPAEMPDEAYAMGGKLLETAWDDAMLLNDVAWSVVDDKGIARRDLEFAMKAAIRANELTESKDAAILDTLARVHFEKGDLVAALKWQRLAVEHAGEDQMGEEIRKVLAKYEAAADATKAEAPTTDK